MVDTKGSAQELTTISAAVVVGVLAVVALLYVPTYLNDWSAAEPLVIFFSVMLINTFFSIRYFHHFEPARSTSQWSINIILFIHYLVLEIYFDRPLWFLVILTSLFAVATWKYILLRRAIGSDAIIARKIRVDGLTTIVAALAVGAAATGAAYFAAWALAIGNIIANIVLLWIHPLYRRGLIVRASSR